MNETVVWLGIWSMLLWAVGMLRGNLLRRRHLKILLLPGLAVEAFCRTIACLVTATPILRYSPLADGRPFLRTGRCPARRIGLPVLVVIRTLLLFVAAYIALKPFPEFLGSRFALPLFDEATVFERGVHWASLISFYDGLFQLPLQLGWGSMGGVLVLYMFLSTLTAAGFSRGELPAALYAWGLLLAVSWVLSWLGVTFGFLSTGWFIRKLYVPEFWSTLSLLVVLSGATVLILGFLHFLPNLVLSFKPEGTPGQDQGLTPVKG
ncbi:MAG: hypothetical protein ACE5GW_01095 [Planctomycetota bacterium]